MSRTPDAYPTSAFAYELPPEQIAQHPAQRRDESRLLVLDRATGRTAHRIFRDVVELISPGDALVLNETRVIPARLLGTRSSGGAAEVLLLHPLAEVDDPAAGITAHAGAAADAGSATAGASAGAFGSMDSRVWRALVRPGAKLKPGRRVVVSDELEVEVVDSTPGGERIVRLHTSLPTLDALERFGRMPLPPYVQREAAAADAERYQTVFARAAGSVAAPTAGLHFTPELLAAIEERGVSLVKLVLHVGVGTFRPVETEDPAEHPMHAEWYEVTTAAATQLNATRTRGRAVWAVGTTVTRTLETVADEAGRFTGGSGWTDIFIRSGYRFRGVDRLITNFHLPRSTLLMLVSAFGGYEHVMAAYREAVDGGYRFYSYGDAMALV